MSVFIDGQYDHSISEKCLYAWLVNRFKNEKKGLWFAYWCTQTALADIYQEKVKSLNQHNLHSVLSLSTTPVQSKSHSKLHSKSYSTCEPVDYHLLDDGRQRIYIKLSDIQKVETSESFMGIVVEIHTSGSHWTLKEISEGISVGQWLNSSPQPISESQSSQEESRQDDVEDMGRGYNRWQFRIDEDFLEN